MKIEVEGEKIVKAVKKSNGIEIVLETADDAKEAVDLILRRNDFFRKEGRCALKDIKVTAFQKYETSAVNYRMVFLLDFVFEEDASLDDRVEAIRAFQEFLERR